MTRLNVYAGPAGFYLVREASDGETGLQSGTLPAPRPGTTANPFDHLAFREVPIVIQDRSFNVDALGNTSLFYPDNRAFFEGFTSARQLKIPFIGDPRGSDISAIWNPEFFGNVMVVNGVSWPFMDVEPDLYRFRLLNGCNSRFLNLSLVALDRRGKVIGEVPFYLIGGDQGLLPKVVEIKTGFATQLPGDGTIPPAMPQGDPQSALLMGLAERSDVLVDFSALPPGTVTVRMLNTAPDAPFGGFPDIPADPGSTGQVMEFRIVADTATGETSTAPASLVLAPMPAPLDPASTPKQNLALIEEESSLVCVQVSPAGRVRYLDLGGVAFNPMDPNNACALAGGVPFAPKAAVLGTTMETGGTGVGMPQMWGEAIRTNPTLNTTETWEIWNFTMDAHPIHLHLVQFQVLGREFFTPDPLVMNKGTRSGVISPAEPWETGYKDTALMYPGMITHVQAFFDIAGLYVWHCHIVEHEDNEMMVPYCVQDPMGGTYCGPQGGGGMPMGGM
jgi:FtsP/CotA-like multicopper oxidase with cupredoxin domain